MIFQDTEVLLRAAQRDGFTIQNQSDVHVRQNPHNTLKDGFMLHYSPLSCQKVCLTYIRKLLQDKDCISKSSQLFFHQLMFRRQPSF